MRLGGQMSETELRLGVGLIGCGLIGQKRAKALPMGDKLLTCADVSLDRAEALAKAFGAKALTDWRAVTENPAIDVVMVATPHHMLAEITLAAVNAGKHVLVEKPAARFASELEPVLAARDNKDVQVHVGFNHRYHRALHKANELVASGALGPLMFIRGRYGHGGRVGLREEWRADPAISGGGELIDQGAASDRPVALVSWRLHRGGRRRRTYFWNMPVDDNGFHVAKDRSQPDRFPARQLARNGRTCSRSKSTAETASSTSTVWAAVTASSALPSTKCSRRWGRPKPILGNIRWATIRGASRRAAFLEDLKTGRPDHCGLEDAIAALTIVETIYKRSGYDHRA